MNEYIFLFIVAGVWIAIASICDLRKREVPNWINFSLPVFALGYRAIYSVFSWNFNFLLFGTLGYLVFIVLGYLFYYGRIFAGGDAKLMMGIGAVLPFGFSFFYSLQIAFMFLFLFFVVGAVYGVLWSVGLVIWKFGNFKKEFVKQINKNKKLFYISLIGVIFVIIGFLATQNFALINNSHPPTLLIGLLNLDLFFIFGIAIFFLPFLYIYAKSIEEVCMIRNTNVKDLTEGDWLYEDVKVGKKIIKASWDGLDSENIELLRKNKKKVLLKVGVPFIPVFFFSFVLFVFLFFNGVGIIGLFGWFV